MKYLAKKEARQTFNILVVAVGLTNDINYKRFIFIYYSLPKFGFTKIIIQEHKSSMVYRYESKVLCPILPSENSIGWSWVNKLDTNVFMVPSYLTVQIDIIRPGKKGRNTISRWVKFWSMAELWVKF